jgi:hypothetical protein
MSGIIPERFMRKKPEYGLGRNEVANKPAARWPLAAVMNGKQGFGGATPMMLFPLKDTPLLAAGFFITFG